MKKIKVIALVMIALLLGQHAFAFCGFYVAKADAKLFNKTSQVIMARDGNYTTITMASDFEGDVKDFAMVVPVPTVLKRKDIRTVSSSIFQKLDDYSGPRLVEYYDHSPCYVDKYKYCEGNSVKRSAIPMVEEVMEMEEVDEDLGVTVEATYDVDEYEVLILSAEESSGLETWLTKNDYKIPAGAKEVLEPYIKNNLKFFVVKVNTEKFEQSGQNELNPLQMSFYSDKFMLPIRLGMANANGDQDMIVYCLTKNGRVETTNYRTMKIPTDTDIPLPVQQDFGKFYKAVFDVQHDNEYGRPVFLEYAWDISGNAGVKCDPCVGPPPIYSDLKEAGASWLNLNNNQNWGNQNYGQCFFTRLHVRYNRQTFPQDLKFQVTPNKERFQGRYVIRHPATGDLSCDEGQKYIKALKKRRKQEVENLAKLTNWGKMKFVNYINEYDKYLAVMEEPIQEEVQKTEVVQKSTLEHSYPAELIDLETPDPSPDTQEYEELEASMAAIFQGEETPPSSPGVPSNKWIFFLALGALLTLVFIGPKIRQIKLNK